MSTTFFIFLALIVIVAFLLIVVIMVQNPKGGGLSANLGGGSAQNMGGVQKTTDFLDKSTWGLATLLLVLILLSNVSIFGGRDAVGESKVFDQDAAPVEAAAPVELPTEPATDTTGN